MTSLTWRPIFRAAGISAHRPPATMPARAMRGSRSHALSTGSGAMATAVAAQAPMWSCPSAPMFQKSILRATITPRPQRMRGVLFTSTSENP